MDMEETVVLLDVECVAVGIEQCQATAVVQSVCFFISFIDAKLYIFLISCTWICCRLPINSCSLSNNRSFQRQLHGCSANQSRFSWSAEEKSVTLLRQQ